MNMKNFYRGGRKWLRSAELYVTLSEKEIDDDSEEKEDDKGGKTADCSTAPRSSRLFLHHGGIGIF